VTLAALPRNPAGKVLKQDLRARLVAELNGEATHV